MHTYCNPARADNGIIILCAIVGVYMLDFIWRNLDVLNVRMKRSLTLLVFVIAALMDVVERTAASVITFQLLLSGDIEENPGPGNYFYT